MSLVILSYNLLKDSVESEFKISFNIIQNSGIEYILRYPSNPILDCQFVNFDQQPINIVVFKILKLIEEDEYGINTRIELIKFKNWIIKVINLKGSGDNLCI